MNQEPDERFESFLRQAAKEYRVPPATPRDEIWAGIVRERRARRARPVFWKWGIGIAAVLALGIGIGRMTAPVQQPGAAVATARPAPAATYRAVANDHLGRVETLLTMFRAETRTGRPDAQVSEAARGLLTTNRLLLDSPAANDPRMKALLEDLELVLAQMAQLSAEKGMDPTPFILRALEDNGVLTRLHSAVPAGSGVPMQGA